MPRPRIGRQPSRSHATCHIVRSPFGDERLQVLLGGLLLALTAAIYWQVGRFGFLVFDDPGYVSENPHVLAGLTSSGIRWAFAGSHDANWIPFTWLSLMADATFDALGPGATT